MNSFLTTLQFRRRCPTWSLPVAMWWTFCSTLCLIFLWVFYRLRRLNRDRIPKSGACLFVANHQSHFDPVIIGVHARDRPPVPMARSTLFKPFTLGPLLRSLGTVSLERGRGDTAAIKAAVKVLEGGGTILMFPEGTRTDDGGLIEFQRGFLLLLRKTKVPVVPVAVEGAFDVWPRSRSFPKLFGRVVCSSQEPIPYDELMKDGPDAAVERIKIAIDSERMMLREWLRARTGGRTPAAGPGDEPYVGEAIEDGGGQEQ